MEQQLETTILNLYLNEGRSLYSIQKEFGIDYHKIRRILSKHGITFESKTIKHVDETEVIRLYTEEKLTLRMVGEQLGIDHHRVARILEKYGVEVTQKNRSRKPFSEEHRRKISESSRGRPGIWSGKKMPEMSVYKNMKSHLQWDVDLDFLLQFDNIEKLKVLNKLLRRERVAEHFDLEKYKQFVIKFYYDAQFNKVYDDYILENKAQYAMPSLDHVIPLSRGGSWELENLQILSWVENRAKYNFLPDEWEYIKEKYFSK